MHKASFSLSLLLTSYFCVCCYADRITPVGLKYQFNLCFKAACVLRCFGHRPKFKRCKYSIIKWKKQRVSNSAARCGCVLLVHIRNVWYLPLRCARPITEYVSTTARDDTKICHTIFFSLASLNNYFGHFSHVLSFSSACRDCVLNNSLVFGTC